MQNYRKTAAGLRLFQTDKKPPSDGGGGKIEDFYGGIECRKSCVFA